MKLTYTKVGDYYLPDLESGLKWAGKYGDLRYQYLRENKSLLFGELMMTGEMNAHLQEINERAHEMLDQLMAQMAKEQGVTEQLKAEDQMKWVGMMNNIQAAAEEIVLNELIYT